MNALASLPPLNVNQFEKAFNQHTQDIIMVAQLAQLTHAQLRVAERLQKMTQ